MTEANVSLVPVLDDLEVLKEPSKGRQLLEMINEKNASIRANNERRALEQFLVEETKMIKRLAEMARGRIEAFLDHNTPTDAEMEAISVSIEARDYWPALTKYGVVTEQMKIQLNALFSGMGRVTVSLQENSVFNLRIDLNEFD